MGNGRVISNSKDKSGFSLLELMFALSILAVAVGAAFSGSLGSQNLLTTTHERRIALHDLRTAMEELLAAAKPEDLPLAGSPFAAGIPVAAYSGLHLKNEQLVVTYPNYTGGSVPNTLFVVMTMSWTDSKGLPHLQDITTAITR